MGSSRRKKRVARNRKYMLVGLVIAAGVVGVWFSQRTSIDADQLLARAVENLDANDHAAAIVDLKTLVGQRPDDRDARVLLGNAYLDTGNAKGALKEFEKARELGSSAAEVGIGLTKALLLTGKFDEAATEIAISGDTSKPDWLVLRGMLDLGQQRLDDARTTFSAIIEQHPDHEEARRGLMQAELAAGNAELARAEVEHLLAQKEEDFGLWLIKGELDIFDQEFESARLAFEKAVELAADNPVAVIGLARVLVELNEHDLATNQLDSLGVAAAEDPRVNFLRARIADARGDSNTAISALKKVLRIAPMHRESLTMAARIYFELAEFSSAQDFVARLLEIDPGNQAAQRMMDAILLASGRADGLGDPSVLNPDVGESQDPGMLALLGTAYLKHGRLEDGRASLERAAELAPDSSPIRTQLAVSRISNGDIAQGIAELEAVVAEDPSFTQARLMLSMAHMANQDFDNAFAVARQLTTEQAESGIAFNLLGYVHESSKDLVQARAAYEKAIDIDPDFHPARINMARLAVNEGDLAGGKAQFEEILSRQPFHSFALMGLAALALQSDDLDEAERLWLLAREHNSDAVAPRLLLAKHFRAKGNRTLAETVVEEAYKLAPYAPQVLTEYTIVMTESQRYEDALTAARALVGKAPRSPAAYELLARVQNQLGDEKGLTETLAKITDLAPEAAQARVLLGRLAIRRKDFAVADTQIEALSKQPQSLSLAYELRGDVQIAQGQIEQALAEYERAHAEAPRSETVLKTDAARRELGMPSTLLTDWLAEHPDDVRVRLVRASQLHDEGTGTKAIAEYERMLKTEGANPIVLNNLAWLYHEQGDERAVALAQQAHELAPQSAEIMDTYGWILVESERGEQGMELLKKAMQAAPDNPDIIFHNASAMHDSGATLQAKKLLNDILEKHPTFPLRAEAESLRARLDAL